MTSRKDTSLGKKLIKVPFTISPRLTDRAHIMEEQKNDPSLSTEVENLSQTSQSNRPPQNDNRPPQNEDSPQTSQSNDDRLPLDERRPCNNFKLPAFWKHNAGSWIALHHHHRPVLIRFFLVSEGGRMHLIPSAIASTPSLHLARSVASSTLNPIFFIFSSTCFFHVCFGRPRFL